jgi:hypothetical protein
MSTERWLAILNAEFGGASDRACAIVAAALVDELLLNVLKAMFVPSPSSEDSLFDGPNAPLSNLSSRIDMAFQLGLISPRLARDLHLIRRIRNSFAHELEGCSFQASGIANQIAELVRSMDFKTRCPSLLGPPYDGPKGNFAMCVTWVLVHLEDVLKTEVKPLEPTALDVLYTCKITDSTRGAG